MIGSLLSRHPRWRRVRLVVVRPPGAPEPHSINEVVASLFHALQSLGCSVDIQENEPLTDGINVFFRAHLLSPSRAAEIPADSVIYNFEQIFERSPWVGPVYRDLLARHTVWDYSQRNLAAIAAIAKHSRLHHVMLGYMPQLSRIPTASDQDIDVLFYGVMTDRRRAILRNLTDSGLRLRIETRVYGAARDELISRAKIVLNLHAYPTAIFEIVRVSYLLANGKAVVGECGPSTEIDDDIRDAIVARRNSELGDAIQSLLRDENLRRDLGRRGQEIFARRRLPAILAQAIAETDAACGDSISLQPAPPAHPQYTGAAGDGSPVNTPKPKRILFHAINGSGLGHVVRLSVIAGTLKDYADIAFFSNSKFADRFWPGKNFGIDPRLDDRFELRPEGRESLALCLALNKHVPDTVVCDTHWPRQIIGQLHRAGIRTALILRTLSSEEMDTAIRRAIGSFSTVLLPHHRAELESTYKQSPALLALLTAAPCLCIGPVARMAIGENSERNVIFTLGGGGEYWNWSEAVSVDRFLSEYRPVAVALRERFDIESILAVGPLLDRPDESLAPFKLVRSLRLYEMFGPNTVVVSRGGYNTCWEAIAAGAGLIIVGDHKAHGVEDVGLRGKFLASEGLARHVQPDAARILDACVDLLERPNSTRDHYLRRSVNSGLTLARDEILPPAEMASLSRSYYQTPTFLRG